MGLHWFNLCILASNLPLHMGVILSPVCLNFQYTFSDMFLQFTMVKWHSILKSLLTEH